jgi:hypothetical protein
MIPYKACNAKGPQHAVLNYVHLYVDSQWISIDFQKMQPSSIQSWTPPKLPPFVDPPPILTSNLLCTYGSWTLSYKIIGLW